MVHIKKKDLMRIDFVMLVSMTAIVVFGLICIGNAGANAENIGDTSTLFGILQNLNTYYVRLQMQWFVLGLALMAVVLLFDYHFFGEVWVYIYVVNLALLVVILFLEKGRGDTNRWFKITEDRTFQMSELSKIAFIITTAKLISKWEQPIHKVTDLLKVLLFAGAPTVLIITQPDVGTALVFVAILAGMLFVSGTDSKLLVGLVCCGLLAMIPLFFLIQGTFRWERIIGFFDPSSTDQMQVTNAGIAIGSGGMFGKGMFSPGSLAALDYVPDNHTDFIFAVAGETMGFAGAFILLALYCILIARMVYLAAKAQDKFGSLITAGVASMLIFHIFINIGMTIRLTPTTGIPLPFVSYGGSSLWSNMIAVAMVMAVNMQRDRKRPPAVNTPRAERHDRRKTHVRAF